MFSSALAGAAAYTLQSQLTFNSWMNLIIGVATFSLMFNPTVLLSKTINKSGIENLRAMTTSLGPINRLLNPALNLVEKLLMLINGSAREPHSSLKMALDLKD